MSTLTSSRFITTTMRNNCILKKLLKLLPKYYGFSQHQRNSSYDNILIDNPKIIIIGAGLSGLSAAQHLVKNGFDNFQILDAGDRFGGRIYTKKFGDAVCELGAPYIIKSNASKSIYDLVKTDTGNLDLSTFNEKSYLTSKGEKLNPDIAIKASKAFDQLLKHSSYLKNTILIDSFNNSKVYLEKETEKLAKTLFKKDSLEACQIFNTLINDYCSFFGCDLSKIHVYQLSKTTPIYNNRITIKNGMFTILKSLLNEIESKQITYSKPVSRIQWSKLVPKDSVTLTCLDNTTYTADHVICTLPLGTLKAFHSILFEPELPIEKINAINNLGVTSPGQFYLKFKENVTKWFTGSITGSIKVAWSSMELGNRKNIATDIVEISIIPNSNYVLEFKRIGDEDFERLNEIKIIKETTNLLRKLLNNPDIPYPNDIIRSYWGTDTKFLGGLPVLTKAYSEKFVENLSSPCYAHQIDRVCEIPKILFAGDATDWDGYGTLDGARQSGIREAQRLLDFYKYKTSRDLNEN